MTASVRSVCAASGPSRGGRRRLFAWAVLVALAACSDPVGPTKPQCEPGAEHGLPYAIPELLESTPTAETIRLVCFSNVPVELRYRIVRDGSERMIEEAAFDWSAGPMPTVTVERHGSAQRFLVWDVRAGELMSTGLWVVEPI